MSKRTIMAAAKRYGVEIARAEYCWIPTPGETVPQWEIDLTPASADHFGETEAHEFASAADVIAFIGALRPYDTTATTPNAALSGSRPAE